MGRPRTPIGEYGNIHTKRVGPSWRAEGHVRHANGELIRVRRHGKTKTAAENTLKKAFREVADRIANATVSPQSTFNQVADLYVRELERQKASGDVSANTVRNYTNILKNWVRPYCGELGMVELTVKTFDDIFARVREQRSKEHTATAKKACRGVNAYAVRHGALKVNLVGQTARIKRGKQAHQQGKALGLQERLALRARIREFCEAKTKTTDGRGLGPRAIPWLGLPDMIDAMLSTGVRIGEILAISEDEVTIGDDGALLVHINHHLVRDKDLGGLVRMDGRKGGRPPLTLGVPSWSAAMWSSRTHAAHERGLAGGERPAPLWPGARGNWQDPTNVATRLRTALAGDKVASHQLRATVTSIIDGADLPVTAMADQLGNTPAVIEKHYRSPRASNQDVVRALEGMWGDSQSGH